MSSNKWEEFYKNTNLDKISWEKTQADYLINVIKSNKVSTGLALDLGCGTGVKSIYLANNGFDVTGIDISKTAIEYANENARRGDVKVNFYCQDSTNLNFLEEKKFELILDWANLHGIPEEKQNKYISEIVKHSKKKGKLILRCFGRKEGEEKYIDNTVGTIILFTYNELESIYSKYFEIIEKNISKPLNSDAPGSFFYELLMEKKYEN